MGKYNFDQIIDRKGTSSLKYDFGMARMGREDLMPLWVADMDFQLPDEILADFHARIDHGIFGYTDPDDAYFEALNSWFGQRHGYTVAAETVTLGAGIVYALATSVKAFTEPGDAVLIQQPVYYPFKEVIEANGRRFINNQLHFENYRYTVDLDDFEQQIIKHKVKVFMLCNPHNPAGRVWTAEELTAMCDICLKHDVLILADEIHCDFVFAPYKFTSLLTLGDAYQNQLVVYTSPSKTFNVAGFQPANIIIPNADLRAKYRAANASAGYSQGSLMGQLAVKACYTKGGQWVDELLVYLSQNLAFIREFVATHLPLASLVEPEGTYLVWIDFSAYGFSDEELEHLVVQEAKLWLDSGKIFGPATAQFERFNMACPKAVLEQAFKQLADAIAQHKRWEV